VPFSFKEKIILVMKKILFALLCCPFFLAAQDNSSENPPLPKHELAISFPFVNTLSSTGRPVYIEYKRLSGKKYYRFGIETVTYNYEDTYQPVSVQDSFLIVDNRSTTKSNGHLKIGIERQTYLKANNRIRTRYGTDLLLGAYTVTRQGSFTIYDLKNSQIKDNFVLPFAESRKDYFSPGLAAFVGVDARISKRIYFGLNVSWNAIFVINSDERTAFDMRLSPYLALKF
jgi:hypothetical protein